MWLNCPFLVPPLLEWKGVLSLELFVVSGQLKLSVTAVM